MHPTQPLFHAHSLFKNQTGQHYLAGQWQAEVPNFFPAINATTFEPMPWRFADCQSDELQHACQAAAAAFIEYRARSAEDRAEFLRQISAQLREHSAELLQITALETALPAARLQGELNRTCLQLEMFAESTKNFQARQMPLPEYIAQFLHGMFQNPFKALAQGEILAVVIIAHAPLMKAWATARPCSAPIWASI